jgi:peptidylprolyl isomerase
MHVERDQDRDYYAILQVSRNATQDEIDRAYERLSKVYDPAISRKHKAAERYQELTEAYEVLSDKERRLQYNRRLAAQRPGGLPIITGEGPVATFISRYSIPLFAAGVVGSVLLALVVIITVGGGGDRDAAADLPADIGPASPPTVEGEFVTTESGLRYLDIEQGDGTEAGEGMRVTVHYTGWLEEDGSKFDSSLDRGEPVTFLLTSGPGGVIPGWVEGVVGMREGGEKRLIIPPDLAYGEEGSPPSVPPNATLIFDVHLIEVAEGGPASPPPVEGEPITTASGLQYIDIEEGTGAEAGEGMEVLVHYTGWLEEDGTKFDSSRDRDDPFQVLIGAGRVIPGWEEGLVGIREGGERRLIIPGDLAYGETGSPPRIPPNATLIFDIELLEVIDPSAQD